MKLIITESQYKKLLSEDTNSDNKVINELKQKLSKGVDKFVSENKKYLDKSSNILDAYSLINKFKTYLISQTPTLLKQMKTGKGGDKFASDSYSELYKLIQEGLNSIGWAKRQFIKSMSPGKEELLKQMKPSVRVLPNGKKENVGPKINISVYFMVFKNILDAGFLVGWMDETKPYNNNLMMWSDSLNKWVDSHQKGIGDNINNLIINSIYK